MKNILYIIAGILLIDLACFLLWVASGQLPADDFFLGAITKAIIKAIIN